MFRMPERSVRLLFESLKPVGAESTLLTAPCGKFGEKGLSGVQCVAPGQATLLGGRRPSIALVSGRSGGTSAPCFPPSSSFSSRYLIRLTEELLFFSHRRNLFANPIYPLRALPSTRRNFGEQSLEKHLWQNKNRGKRRGTL